MGTKTCLPTLENVGTHQRSSVTIAGRLRDDRPSEFAACVDARVRRHARTLVVEHMSWDTMGTQLTSRQLAAQYPSSRAKKGIDYGCIETGEIHRVLVVRNKSYPNTVQKGRLHYCYSPDSAATRAMEAAFKLEKTFLVVLAGPGACENRVFSGRIAVLCESYQHENGKAYKRYIIEDVHAPAMPPATASTPAPAAVEASGTPPTPIPAATSDNVQRKRVLPDGYDSFLELRHARCMVALGMHVDLHVPTVHGIDVGDTQKVAYTPDFMAITPSGIRFVVEIKPRYPYDVEVRRCLGYVRQLPERPLVLLYNTAFVSPFAVTSSGDGQGNYSHAEGVRGMLFRWKGDKVEIEHNAVYFCEEDAEGAISDAGFRSRTFHSAEEDHLYYNRTLECAFRAADDEEAKCPRRD